MRVSIFVCGAWLLAGCGSSPDERSPSQRAADDLVGVWISTDTSSRVEFLANGQARVSDPLTSLGATWLLTDGGATIAVGDTTNAPLDIAVTKRGDMLVMRIDTDTLAYARATPVMEAAFARMSNNEAINAMTQDLMALRDAQDTHLQLSKKYSKALPMGFMPANGVAITVTDATASTWSAIATHPATKTRCVIVVGNGTRGVVNCGS